MEKNEPHGAAGAGPLGHAIRDVESRRKHTIYPDAGSAASHQDVQPADDSLSVKAKVGRSSQSKGSGGGIIGLRKVRVQHPTGETQLLEPGGEAEVVEGVGGDDPIRGERCLSHINDIVKRPVEASTYDVHDKFDVTVEEGDGAVTNKLIPRLARLVDEANDTEEERGEGGGAGGGLEGGDEDAEEHRG